VSKYLYLGLHLFTHVYDIHITMESWNASCAVADLDQNYWGSQNNILKIYIFNITIINSIKK